MSDFELEVEDLEEGDEGHTLLSPSGAPRYLRCLASPFLCKDYPNKETEDSKAGTRAHALAAKALNMNADRLCAGDDPEEMIAAVNTYIADVRRIDAGAVVAYNEKELDMSGVLCVPGEKGTADRIAVVGHVLKVHDLKYGNGVAVSAENNEQLMEYALGALEWLEPVCDDIDTVELYIHQPRLGYVSSWTISAADLVTWCDEVLRPSVEEIMRIYTKGVICDGDIVPGDKQCRFCLAKADCPANRKMVLDAVAADFDDFDQAVVSDPAAVEKALHAQIDAAQFIQPEQIAHELPYYDLMIKVIKARKERALELALQGLTIPGFKVVAGREGNRKWKDEAVIADVLKGMRLTEDERFKQVVISPTDAEKIFTKGEKKSARRWNRLQNFITRSEAKPTLVPLSDKREPLALGCKAEEFSDGLPEPLTQKQIEEGYAQESAALAALEQEEDDLALAGRCPEPATLEPHPDAEEPMDNSIFL